MSDTSIPPGYCQCGCGERTELATHKVTLLGWVKGKPKRYIHGHNPNVPLPYDLQAGTRTCKVCKRTLPAIPRHFYRRKKSADGFSNWCKPCSAAYHVGYYAKHKQEALTSARHHKAVRRQLAGSHTSDEIWTMYESQDGLCAYCETPLFGTFHVDHMLPASRGGSDDWTNLCVSCPSCNIRKRAKTAEEFMNE